MNEQAIQQVITDYAIENANLSVAVATLRGGIGINEKRSGKGVIWLENTRI